MCFLMKLSLLSTLKSHKSRIIGFTGETQAKLIKKSYVLRFQTANMSFKYHVTNQRKMMSLLADDVITTHTHSCKPSNM